MATRRGWHGRQERRITTEEPAGSGHQPTPAASAEPGTAGRTTPPTDGAGRAKPTAASQVDLSGIAELKAILRIRAFRRLWAVLGLSSLGDWLGLLATSTFAAGHVSGSVAKGAAFSSVIAVRLLPALVLGPIAGVFADRFDRRYTMVVCDLIRFVFFASIPAAGLVTHDARLIVAWAAIATFVIETAQMLWAPAKEASVPNLLPRARLEAANQLTLATTYGITPVVAGLVLSVLTNGLTALYATIGYTWIAPNDIALYFDALTFLATALTVLFGIKEISGHGTRQPGERKPGVLREFIDGWKFVGRTPLIRGLVLGILGAFAGGGVVVGSGQAYAVSLGGGNSTFYLLFAMLFVGLGIGIVAGPRLVGGLSRRRMFGVSIVLAAGSVALLAVAPHLTVAVAGTLLVGVGAGMAFLSGTTLLGGEVDDEVRGRAFAVVQTGTSVVLMLTIAASGLLVGAGGSRLLSLPGLEIQVSTTRLLLGVAGVLGVIAGLAALRQMDDKAGVPILADLIGSLRGRPLSPAEPKPRHGLFVVFEGGEGAGKSTQVRLLADALRAQGHHVLVTREPGATEVGERIRNLLLHEQPASTALTPRAEALLYAADRAHHVAAVIRPALARGEVVISDRYVDSSLAYQGAGRTLPVDEVSWLSSWATGGLKPDLTVLLDVDPRVGLDRVGARGTGEDRIEGESDAFHERVRYAFLDLAAADSGRYLVLDANRQPEAIAAVVAERISELLPPVGVPSRSRADGEPSRCTDDSDDVSELEGPTQPIPGRSA
ncbi:dTMP kinase [Planosporangium thailandense]|uniref:Thymidylate kinase n=1 Tax=Planosporangium thailandense TaxID=765197 RepID=A0ABX0XTU2_9ACTN|nr:dTMP kinase [Planosporangium thailandense]NJC69213.1 dTMP kinase [Planosporangium thailandense]